MPLLQELAVYNMPVNGFWHVCKANLLKLYDWCFTWLIVPLRRRTNAGQTVYKANVKVGTVVRTFNILAEGYDQERARWHRLYDDATSQPRVALEQFFEFLIPFVRSAPANPSPHPRPRPTVVNACL